MIGNCFAHAVTKRNVHSPCLLRTLRAGHCRTRLTVGVISKSVGGTLVVQLVSTSLRTSKKSRTMLWAHALASSDGLPNATCATLGISTTVEFVSVRATRGPKDGAVWASYCAEMTSVGMLLSVMSRIELDTGGTFQTTQFERMNWRFGAFLWTESGNVGNARRPAAMTLLALS